MSRLKCFEDFDKIIIIITFIQILLNIMYNKYYSLLNISKIGSEQGEFANLIAL
jgi:hypothetical protein